MQPQRSMSSQQYLVALPERLAALKSVASPRSPFDAFLDHLAFHLGAAVGFGSVRLNGRDFAALHHVAVRWHQDRREPVTAVLPGVNAPLISREAPAGQALVEVESEVAP